MKKALKMQLNDLLFNVYIVQYVQYKVYKLEMFLTVIFSIYQIFNLYNDVGTMFIDMYCQPFREATSRFDSVFLDKYINNI